MKKTTRGAILALTLLTLLTLFQGTPSPHPADAAAVSWETVRGWIYEDAAYYGVSGLWLEWVAICESAYNPYAVGRLGEVGVFQWHPRGLWWSTPAGRNGESPWDLRRNVEMAAWAFAHGYWFHWSCAR